MTNLFAILAAAVAVSLAALLVVDTVMARRPVRRHGDDDTPGIG